MKDYYFIMNAGVKAGGEITHAVLEGKIVSAPKGYDAFTGIEAIPVKRPGRNWLAGISVSRWKNSVSNLRSCR